MNESVTSVSKREQRLGDVASAITILTRDDLERSGAMSVMEAMRLVPGANVGQVNSNQWSISVRGFNGVFSNKLLVVVDGRTVYSPFFSGVYWDLQMMGLEDVDRIEVIRGPGATVWGANAVNGVINVVSSSARDTQGGLLYGGGGDQTEALAGARYGGQIGPDTYYRVYGSYRSDQGFPLATGQTSNDSWDARTGGFRLDHYPNNDTQLTWQVAGTDNNYYDNSSTSQNFHTLGRWTHQWGDRSNLEIQAYYDRVNRNVAGQIETHSDTLDFSVEHSFGLGPDHTVIWGLGYRNFDASVDSNTPLIRVTNTQASQQLFSAFGQSEFQVIPEKLILTAGAKIEHNDYTGWEIQPSVRGVFKPTADSSVWAAVSRALRTPNIVEGKDIFGLLIGEPFQGPGGVYLPTTTGNSEVEAEIMLAYELGYRVQLTPTSSIDLTVFQHDYQKLISVGDPIGLVPGVPYGVAVMPFTNSASGQVFSGESHGIEASYRTALSEQWRMTLNYSWLDVSLNQEASNLQSELNSPQHQVSLRSSYDFTPRTNLDVQMRYASKISGAAAYTTADIHLAHQLTDRLTLSLVGRNLFDPQHPEQEAQAYTTTTEVPRSFHAILSYRF